MIPDVPLGPLLVITLMTCANHTIGGVLAPFSQIRPEDVSEQREEPRQGTMWSVLM
jgi:hypothetical protein